jgi:hypothetical protein
MVSEAGADAQRVKGLAIAGLAAAIAGLWVGLVARGAAAQACNPAFEDFCLIVPTGQEGQDVAPYCFLPTLLRGENPANWAVTASDAEGACHDFETYLRFDLPVDLLAPGEAVLEAQLIVPYTFSFAIDGEPSPPPHAPVELRVHRVLGPWSESSLTWLNRPAFDPVPHDARGGITDFGDIDFDVTELVRGWADGTLPNFGLVLTTPNDRVLGFRSWEAPVADALKTALLIVTGPDEELDGDADGIPDAADACPSFANATPLADTDADGIPDDCQCGDATGDGRLNVLDSRRIKQCAVLLRSDCDPEIADANGDGSVNVLDARRIDQVVVRLRAPWELTCARRPEGDPPPAGASAASPAPTAGPS